MKKTKQILAIIGIIILVGMYVLTLVCACSANDNFMGMLMASILATFIIPILIWCYERVYLWVKRDAEAANEKNDSE